MNRLKEIRYSYKMNQKEFAKMLGIGYVKYNLYENNRFTPMLTTAVEISKKLDKDIRDIFYNIDD